MCLAAAVKVLPTLSDRVLPLLLIRHRDQHRPHLDRSAREAPTAARGTFTGPAGTFRKRTDQPRPEEDLLQALAARPTPRARRHPSPSLDRDRRCALRTSGMTNRERR